MINKKPNVHITNHGKRELYDLIMSFTCSDDIYLWLQTKEWTEPQTDGTEIRLFPICSGNALQIVSIMGNHLLII